MGNSIDPKKTRFEATYSQGPGGQNLNRRSTKVHLWIKVNDLNLNDTQKKLVRKRLKNRITKNDELEVTNDEGREQEENRARALTIMDKLIEEAVRKNPPRVQQ